MGFPQFYSASDILMGEKREREETDQVTVTEAAHIAVPPVPLKLI